MAYKKVFYTRRYQPPPPAVGHNSLYVLFKKRKLEEVRAALENGKLEQQHDASYIDTDDEESNASTSCTASPRSSRAAGADALTRAELEAQREQLEAHAAAERAADTARRKAEDELLKTIHAKLQEQQAAAAAEKLAAKHELEEQHAAATQQISEIQQRLEELREAKHDLVKQLKQAMQEEQAAKQQQAALQQQQQMQQMLQQQQDFWQQQQMQQQQQAAFRGVSPLGIPSSTPQYPANNNMTPRPDSLASPAAYTPGYGGVPTPSGGVYGSGANGPGFTPRGGLVSTPGAARSQWLFSTPAQPPPPPPRLQQHHQQQPLFEFQKQQHIADPAIAGTHGPLHGSAAATHGGQQQQYQQQHHGGPGTASWGHPPARPSEHQQPGHTGTMPGSQSVHDVHSSRWQDRCPSKMAAAAAPETSPHRGLGSKRHRDRDMQYDHCHAPDSPEEGEALPSPPPPHLRAVAAAVGPAGQPGSHAGDRDRLEAAHSSAAGGCSGGELLRTGSGGGSVADRAAAAAERPGLLRANSAGGVSASHLLSPPSSGGSIRGGGGGIRQSQSTPLDSRPRGASGRHRAQQEHYGTSATGRAEEGGQHTWHGKRRHTGTSDKFEEGKQQSRQSGVGPDSPAERGDRHWGDSTQGRGSGRGAGTLVNAQQADTSAAGSKHGGGGRQFGSGKGRGGSSGAWK